MIAKIELPIGAETKQESYNELEHAMTTSETTKPNEQSQDNAITTSDHAETQRQLIRNRKLNSNQMMRAFKTKNKHDHNKHLGQFSWTHERRSHQHQMQERLRITHGQHHRKDADVFAEILREALHIQPQPATTTMTPIKTQELHDAIHQFKKGKHQTREVSPQK